ncbi:MAG TPA: sigma-70 family RNA polymerase sigma factor [Candidatus Polarisedimenticolaceae bacterium]|nr:sigma-70 family RNA polymerase sigma factor [Candidatus Polarisedimenticolaceae bacterium]
MYNAAAGTSTTPSSPDFERIFQEHQRGVLRAAYRVTGNAQDAEDVLQTVFLRLVRREGGSPLSDSLGSYLHRAAVNAALDVVRGRHSSRAVPIDGSLDALADGTAIDPTQRQEAEELRERIRQSLGRMSPRSAEIFVLRYFEGYDNHEIARMLGTSRSTVNVILHRTRERLRDELLPTPGERA